jgi:hypothetical protein
MKVLMQGSEVFGAAGTVQNVLAGERYERPPFMAVGDLYGSASAINLVTSELNVGGFSVTGQIEVGAQNRLPLVPDDLLIGYWPVEVGQLIQLRATASAAATFFWRVDLEQGVIA